jgi:pimeloyl-ACP methyl ester carboxylesterase
MKVAVAVKVPVVAADGMQLHLHRVGSAAASGRPLLMIPGMFCDQRFFLQRGGGLAHSLAARRPVFVLERRRTGTFEQIVAEDVRAAAAAVARETGAARLVLLGHSAGAGAALCAALSQVRALLSLDACSCFALLCFVFALLCLALLMLCMLA